MEQRLEYSNSHLTCCSHFPWPLFIAHTWHSGALILTKKSCSFALRAQEKEAGWSHLAWSVSPSHAVPTDTGINAKQVPE